MAGKTEPNHLAHEGAQRILACLLEAQIKPDRVVADADGALGVYLVSTTGRGRFAVDNDGDAVAHTVVGEQLDVWEFDLTSQMSESLARMRENLKL